ncbi:MAG: dTDP-glucose 4,6-dehydratase [Bacteroidota bacterium]
MEYALVTGGAGFIGSNFINYKVPKKDYHYINLDALTYAGNLANIAVADFDNYTFIKGDIRDKNLIDMLFKEYQFKKVYHFAAESHVDNSIANPNAFIETNINGTFNLLHAAYQTWMNQPFEIREQYKKARFLHVSTDEVYGTLGDEGLFTEETPYAPNSPYSASKASSDFLVRSYFHTYGMPVVTTNCSNNYGPNQHDEKLIPTIIRKALQQESIPIYGNGKNIRDWLFVLDHCTGIELAMHQGKLGETYNIGGKNERTNIYIAEKICHLLDEQIPLKNKQSYTDLIKFVQDRPGHDFRYAIDASKIENDLGWQAQENFESGIKKTIDWYIQKYQKE